MLVHPKDKVDLMKKAGVVYQVPCKNCTSTYIGETERCLGTRINEHRKEVEAETKATYTRSQRKTSETQRKKSAITDHARMKNHVIDWEGIKIIDRDSDSYE